MFRKRSLLWPVIIGILGFVLIRLLKTRKLDAQLPTKKAGHGILHKNHKTSPGQNIPVQEKQEKVSDLRIIEGIGPKISKILRDAGILSFKQLSNSKVEDIKAILAQSNIRLAVPTTWPEQAAFADNEDWEGLKSLQAQLKGGRRVN